MINPFLNESYEVPEPFLILNVTLFSSIVAFHVILWSLAELVGAECWVRACSSKERHLKERQGKWWGTTYCFVFVLSVLDGESLQRCFFNRLRDVCFEWQKQSPPLRPLKRFLLVSTHAIRNTRRKMEDRHVILMEFNQLFGLAVSLDSAGESSSLVFQRCNKHSGLVICDLWNGEDLLPWGIYHVCAGASTYFVC